MKVLSEESMSQIVGGKMFDYQQREFGCLNGHNHVETTLTVFWIPIHWSRDFPC